jgi:hypothetical protein
MLPQPRSAPKQRLVLRIKELSLTRKVYVAQYVGRRLHCSHFASDDVDKFGNLVLDAIVPTAVFRHIRLKPHPSVHEVIVQRGSNLGGRFNYDSITRF